MWCRIKTPASPFLSKSFGGNYAWQAIQSHLAWHVKRKLAQGKSESETKWMWCQTFHCISLSRTVSGLDSTWFSIQKFGHNNPGFRLHLISPTIPNLNCATVLWWNIWSRVHLLYVQKLHIFYHLALGQIRNILKKVYVCVKVNNQEKISPEWILRLQNKI